MTIEELNELETEFYGEDDEEEGGAYEDNYECAEWARRNVGSLFETIRQLLTEKSE
jgi:hypothetical protein